MIKKSIALMLTIIMAFTLFGIAFADTERTSGLFRYQFKGNGTIKITGYDWANNTDDIYIPSLIDGYPVTGIAEKAFEADSETKANDYTVTIANGITGIGDFAFLNAPVSTINVPDSVTEIGNGVFLTNSKRGYVNIIVSPSNQTFTTIDGVLFNKKIKELIAFPVRDFHKYFSGYGVASSLRQYEIPNGITSIAPYAFCNVEWAGAPNSINIPDTVTVIGKYAFANSSYAMLNININETNNIETIGEGAFHGNYVQLMSFNYLTKVSSIEPYCFFGAKFGSKKMNYHYEDFMISPSITQIGDYAFCGFGLKEEQLREDSSSELRILEIPGTVKTLGNSAFRSLNHQSDSDYKYDYKVKLSKGVETVGEYCFANNNRLTAVEIEDGIITIGKGAFTSCPNLATVILPASVSEIGDDAFDKGTTTLIVVQDSYAEKYAKENGIQYRYDNNVDDLSWLNN